MAGKSHESHYLISGTQGDKSALMPKRLESKDSNPKKFRFKRFRPRAVQIQKIQTKTHFDSKDSDTKPVIFRPRTA